MKTKLTKMFTLLAMVGLASTAAADTMKITPAQKAYLQREVIAIVHWGLNTYTGQEWGDGTTNPLTTFPSTIGDTINPTQWVTAMKAGGIKEVILVAKHHDGFCLWPAEGNDNYSTSAFATGHSFKNYNLIKKVRDACVLAGIDFGVYVSPWDRHHADWGHNDGKYTTYFQTNVFDIIENYGPISEMWFDGATGDYGYYGGAKESRSLPTDAKTYYGFSTIQNTLNTTYPLAVIFGGGCSNSVCWAGNELGNVPTDWSYDRGSFFGSPEADTPVGGSSTSSKGAWFWHSDHVPKSLKQMVKNYFESVGHGGVLNWGIAPNQEGLIPDADVARLKEFGDYIAAYNKSDLFNGATAETNTTATSVAVTLTMSEAKTFNAIDFGENLDNGQIVTSWTAEVRVNNAWQSFASGTKAGWRRIAKLDNTVTADAVRITANGATTPTIERIYVRNAATVQDDGSVDMGETDSAEWMTRDAEGYHPVTFVGNNPSFNMPTDLVKYELEILFTNVTSQSSASSFPEVLKLTNAAGYELKLSANADAKLVLTSSTVAGTAAGTLVGSYGDSNHNVLSSAGWTTDDTTTIRLLVRNDGERLSIYKDGVLIIRTDKNFADEGQVKSVAVGGGLASLTGNIVSIRYREATRGSVDEILNAAYMWLDASDATTILTNDSGAVTNWTSRNTSGKAATSYTTSPVTGGPTVSTETLADMKYVDFGSAGSGQDLQFTRSTAVRTVFMVADVATGTQNVFFLGDSSGYKFHRGGSGQYFNATHGAPFLSGTYRNGEKVADPANTQVPSGFGVYTLVASEAVPASRICQDRTESGRNGGKKIAELLIFEKTLTDREREQVEDYLMEKWLGREIYTAAVSGTQDFDDLTWDPSKPTDFEADGVVTRLIATNGAAKVNFASAQTIGNLRIDTAAGNLLSVSNLNNLTATKLDLIYADEGLGVDATGSAEYEVNSTWLTYLRDNEVKMVFKGNGANGAKLDFADSSLSSGKTLKSHLVFEGGAHAFKWINGVKDPDWGANATEDNPNILVRDGTTLTFTGKDLTGWTGSQNINGIMKVENGGVLQFQDDGSSSLFYRQRLSLMPGGTIKLNTASDRFHLYGGTDEAKAQIYMPASDEGNAEAKIEPVGSNGAIVLTKDDTKGVAISVGENSTLAITSPITTASDSSPVCDIKKYGAGTLKLGDMSGYCNGSTFTTAAGTLVLKTGSTYNANATYVVSSGATLAFSDATATTIPKLTLNAGAILLPKNTVTVSGTLTAGAFTLDATHLIDKATTAGTNEVVALTVTGSGTIPAATIENGDGWMTVSSGTELKIVKLGSTGLRVSDMEAGKSYGLGADPTLTFDRKPTWTTGQATLVVSGTLTLAGTVDVTPAMLNCFVFSGADTINYAWQTREVISLNFGSTGTMSGDTSDGALAGIVYGSSWNNFTADNNSNKPVNTYWNGNATTTKSSYVLANWDSRAAHNGGGAYSAQFQKGYLDDGTAKEVTVSVTSIPYSKYSVIIYYSTDSTGDPKFHTPYVNNKYYTADKTTGVTSEVSSRGTWGVGNSVTVPKFGSNAIRIDDLTGNLSINAYKNATQRGTLAAIQIINTTGFVDYDADITAETATWSTKAGLSNPSSTWENGSTNTISLFNKFDGSTLTFDSAVTARVLSVVSASDKAMTLTTNNAPDLAIASYNFEGADGQVTVNFSTGANPVIAGADTILTQLGTGTITVGAGKKLTLKDGARSWDTSKITVDADGELVIGTGDTALTTVPFAGRASQYTTVAGVVTYAGNIETTTADDFQFAYSISRNFDTGCDISAPRMVNGNQSNVTQTFNQYDGEIEITGTGDMTASEQNAPILFAHWPSTVTYNLLGGSLTATNGVKGSVYFSRDGNAVLNIGGGTATATLRTNGLIDDDRKLKDRSATWIDIQANGVFEVGSFGIKMVDSREHFYLSGGTIAAYEDATVSVADGIEVKVANSVLAAKTNTTLTVAAALKGSGTPLFIGADDYTGTVAITNAANAFYGTVSVHPSATLEVPAATTSFNVVSTSGGTLRIVLTDEQKATLATFDTGVRAYGFNGTLSLVDKSGTAITEQTASIVDGTVKVASIYKRLTWDNTNKYWIDEDNTQTTPDSNCWLALAAGDEITLSADLAPHAICMPDTGTVSIQGYKYVGVTSLTLPEGAVLRLVVESDGPISDKMLKGTLALSGAGNVELYRGGYVNGMPVVDANFASDFTGRLVVRRGQFRGTSALKSSLAIQVTDGGNLYLSGGTWNNHFYLSGSGWNPSSASCWDKVSLRLYGNQLGDSAVLEFITEDGKKGSIGNMDKDSEIGCSLVGTDGFRIDTAAGTTLKFKNPLTQTAGLAGTVDLVGGNVTFGTGSVGDTSTIFKFGDKLAIGSGCLFTLHTRTDSVVDTSTDNKAKFGSAIDFNGGTLHMEDGSYVFTGDVTVNSDSTMVFKWKKGRVFQSLKGSAVLTVQGTCNTNASEGDGYAVFAGGDFSGTIRSTANATKAVNLMIVPIGTALENATVDLQAYGKVKLVGDATLGSLTGSQEVVTDGSAHTLTLKGGDFSGTIANNVTLVVAGTVKLTGTYAGAVTVNAESKVQIGSNNVAPSAIVNNGTVEYLSGSTCNLNETRAMPSGVIINDGATVKATQTRLEYAKGLTSSFTGFTSVGAITLNKLDGTSENLTVDAQGNATSTAGSIHIDGAATLFDVTFTNLNDIGKSGTDQGTFSYKAVSGAQLKYDSGATFYQTNPDVVKERGVYIKHHPYIDKVASTFNGLGDFTAVFVGTMSEAANTIFVHFGSTSGSNKGILIATMAETDKVGVFSNEGGTLTSLKDLSVPNSATARHVYIVTKKTVGENTVFTIYLDGVKRAETTQTGSFVLGTSSHCGVQVGSPFGGGTPKCGDTTYSAVDATTGTGVLNVCRIYDYLLTDEQVSAIKTDYPYISQGGLYTRSVTGAVDYLAAATWTKSGEATAAYDVPTGTGDYKPSATLTATGDGATITVNTNSLIDTFTFNGSAMSFVKDADGTNKITVATADIQAPVTNRYNVLDLSSAAIQVSGNGALTFDFTDFDLTNCFANAKIQITGMVDQNDEKIKAINIPTATGRTATFGYDDGEYYLTVAVDTTIPFVFTIAKDAEEGTWTFGEGGQTVTADIVNANTTFPIWKKGDGSMTNVVINRTYFVKEGTMVAGEAANKTGAVTVDANATFDYNGKYDGYVTIALNGGSLVNNGTDMGMGNRQIEGISLTANSTVGGTGTFGLLSNGYAANVLDLGGFTLTKQGTNTFFLCNTTVTNGTVVVSDGVFAVGGTGSYPATFIDAGLNLGEKATLRVDGSKTLTIGAITGTAGAAIQNNGTISAFTLTGTAKFDGSGTYGTVTLAENAVADIGTLRNLTFAGAGKVNVTLTAGEDKYNTQTGALFTRVAESTATIGIVTDSKGNTIPSNRIEVDDTGTKITIKPAPTVFTVTKVESVAQTNFNGSVIVATYGEYSKGDYDNVEFKINVGGNSYDGTLDEEKKTVTFCVPGDVASASNVYAGAITVVGKCTTKQGAEDVTAYDNTAWLYQGITNGTSAAEWFKTWAVDTEVQKTNGSWNTEPSAKDSKIVISENDDCGYDDYVFRPNSVTGQVAVVDMRVSFDAAQDDLTGDYSDRQGALRAVTDAEDDNVFRLAALVNGAWVTNADVAVELGVEYPVRTTFNYRAIPATVTYEVATNGDYQVIAAGNMKAVKSALESVTFNGTGKLAVMTGSNCVDTVDASLVEDGAGNKYANLNAAFDKDGLKLLWDASWTPSDDFKNNRRDFTLVSNDHKLYLTPTDGVVVEKVGENYRIIGSYYEVMNLLFGDSVTTNKFMYFTNAVAQTGEEYESVTNLYLLRDVTITEALTISRDIWFNGESNILAVTNAAITVDDDKAFTIEGGNIGIPYAERITLKGGRFNVAATNSWNGHLPEGYTFAEMVVAEREGYLWQMIATNAAPKAGEVLMPVKTAEGESVAVVVSNSWAEAVTDLKEPAQQSAALSVVQSNGLTRLDNEILGLVDDKHEVTATQIPVIQPVQATDTDKVTFQLGNVSQKAIKDSGARVKYRVWKGDTPGAKTTASDATNSTDTIKMDLPKTGVQYYLIEVDTGTVK